MKNSRTKYWVAYNDNPHIPVGVFDTLKEARADARGAKKQDPKGKYTVYRVTKLR